MRAFLPGLVALVALLGIAPAAARSEEGVSRRHTLAHQGRTRSYLLHVPPEHAKAKAVPLVLALHGGGGNAAQMDRGTGGQVAREADRRGWVVAFPEGIAKGWNDGRKIADRRARARRGVDDVDFLRRVIDAVHASHGIDRSRVYATGISNGGFMSIRLGLELSDRIAAIAPVTAQIQKVHATKTPAHPVGLMVINGTKDPLVPYGGGHVRLGRGPSRGEILSTDATVQRWAGFLGIPTPPKDVMLPNRRPLDGTRTTRRTWTLPDGRPGVVLLSVAGGGHTWPGGAQYLPRLVVGRTARDFEAAPLIFDFFAQHRRTPRSAPPAPVDQSNSR